MGSKSDAEGDKYMAQLRRQALSVMAFWNNKMEDFDDMGIQVLEMRIQAPRKTGGDFRVILKAVTEDNRPMVAFGNGGDFQTALNDLKSRAEQVGIRWKDDLPWTPGKAAQ